MYSNTFTFNVRWSAIAARLPGRTDNEIKNVWHTHLKKRLNQTHSNYHSHKPSSSLSTFNKQDKIGTKRKDEDDRRQQSTISVVIPDYVYSPQQSNSDDISTLTTTTTNTSTSDDDNTKLDDSFWSEVLSADHSTMAIDHGLNDQLHLSSSPSPAVYFDNSMTPLYDNMDFWFNLLTRPGELTDLLEI